MSSLLTGLVTMIYLGIAVDHAWSGRAGLALTFAAYALANVGLIWTERSL